MESSVTFAYSEMLSLNVSRTDGNGQRKSKVQRRYRYQQLTVNLGYCETEQYLGGRKGHPQVPRGLGMGLREGMNTLRKLCCGCAQLASNMYYIPPRGSTAHGARINYRISDIIAATARQIRTICIDMLARNLASLGGENGDCEIGYNV
jgi:hypothetical protein